MLSHYDLAQLCAKAFTAPWTGTTSRSVHFNVVSASADEVVVALPGTNPSSEQEWLVDASFWPSWFPGVGYLHQGFGSSAQEVLTRIKPALPTDRLVTFTGYSLGGAVASCLAAMHAAQRPGVRFRTVTFGAARVAFLNMSFGRLLSKGVEKTFYARRGDIVPNLPSVFYLHGGPQTDIGVSLGDVISDQWLAHYATDVKALGV